MKAYFTGYRCNCTILEKTTDAIPDRCPNHDAEVIYGLFGKTEQVEVDDLQQMGLYQKEVV